MKKIGKRFCMMLFALAVVILPFNVGAKTHDFSLKVYDFDITANDWEGDGTGDEIEENGLVEPGQIFQVDLYYKAPQTIEQTMALQTAIKHDKKVVEPIYAEHRDGVDDDVYVDVDMTTTAFGGLWPPRGKSATQKKQTNWTVQYHDDAANEMIKFLITDSRLEDPLTTEGTLASVYFKVKDNVVSSTDIAFDVDYAFTKAAGVVPGGLPKTTSGITIKVK